MALKQVRYVLRVRRRRCWGRDVRKNAMSNVYIVRVCSLKVTRVKNGFDAKNV